MRIEWKKGDDLKMYVARVRGVGVACQQIDVDGVDTLQAVEPPCNVSNGPPKDELGNLVSNN